MAFIKYADDRQKLMRFLDRYCKGRTISGNAVDVINAFTKAKIKRAQQKQEVKMCQAIIELKQIAREEGERKGKREGERKGKREGIKEGKKEGEKKGKLDTLLANIRSLNKTLGLTYEEAMKALRVPKAKREELLKLLPST